MRNKPSALFFDKNDYKLLRIVNDVLARGTKSQALRSLLLEHLHPHGIKEMAAPRGLRIAYAIAGLLGSFEKGKAIDRIKALRSLRDEVFLTSATFYQKNTARVLLQIMKELVRSKGRQLHQLKLAHDFRIVSTGNPRKVRSELAKYHLIEMPEEWNQFAFDDHVHDANTKGRKSPTHLVMDAWIKGIRYLTVVYYNYVRPEVVEELIEASSILDIRVQIGIEMSTRFRDKYARFTWEPHGFNGNRAFLRFLQEEAVIQLMEQGREVSGYQQKYVFDVLAAFNERHREILNKKQNLSLEPLSLDDFITFVGTGQPSILHLARFIHNALSHHIKDKIISISAEQIQGKTDRSEKPSTEILEYFQSLNVEAVINEFLLPQRNPEVHDPNIPQNSQDLPQLLQSSLPDLLSRLLTLHSSSKFTLNLSNLSVQDTMELLFAGAGKITHIETYNLKNATHGMSSGITAGRATNDKEPVDLKSSARHYQLVSELQQALNDDNVIKLKRVIRAIIRDHEEQTLHLKNLIQPGLEEKEDLQELTDIIQHMESRTPELGEILYKLETFHNYYKKRTLRSRIGSGSTGQAEHQYGMGLVVLDTISKRARKPLRGTAGQKDGARIPVSALLTGNSHKRLYHYTEIKTAENYPELSFHKGFCTKRWMDWTLDGFLVHIQMPGNIATLGGLNKNGDTGILQADEHKDSTVGAPWKYLNTNVKNSLKVLFGFLPAFLTFNLTKDWWVLAYLGAFIWFGITGSRNIIQSVLGGGGLRRSPLLPWNSLVSWSRISDSLLYTGFSVPLLDYFTKTLLLDQALGVTTGTNPILLYSVMGIVNGIYISSHNALRGLPKGATIGNFFRSILAIPVAILLNTVIGAFLLGAGVPDVTGALQKWAAILSKFASDCVAGVIEGVADRQTNIRRRLTAYRTKVSQLFTVFSKLSMQFPEDDVLEMLQSPKTMIKTLNKEAQELEKLIIVNALDLMYFWMYQPRARKALTMMAQKMSEEEWLIFYRSQLILKRHKEISQVFVDGLVGKNFSKALSFYLDQSKEHLTDLKKLGENRNTKQLNV